MASKKAKLSRIYGDENRKELLNLIQKLGYRWGAWEVFNDFLLLMSVSIVNSADPYHIAATEETWKEREARYMDTINKYSKEERMLFPQMGAALVAEMEKRAAEEDYRDVLGEVFHECEFHNKWKGQFFTPQHICNMMGRMSMGEAIQKAVDVYGYVAVNEPCCGGGAMIYGFLNAFRKEGFNPSRHLLVVANDVDERCVWMTYIQCSLYGLPALIRQMNTLSMETYGAVWATPVYVWEGWNWREKHRADVIHTEEEVLAMLEA